jgi:glycosyltransferase involved in cell wall biosynthesis
MGRSPGPLRVKVATPLGLHGRGGIDRLNDMIFEEMAETEGNICLDRLVTRGQGSLFAAQFTFAYALAGLTMARLRQQVDVLHIHLSDKGSSYRKATLGVAAKLMGIPYVVHLHGAIFREFWFNAPQLVAGAIDRLFRQSEHIIVLGQHWADVISGRLPDVAGKITILPNATPPASLGQIPSADGRVRITCLGQLGKRKGTPQLIEALGLLQSESGWVATIAGNGDVAESRTRVQALGIADRVDIPGWLDSAAANELLCRTDVLVLPSFAENLPMVILEAFAHGVPVVSTPVGAISEVVESDRNGLLVPVGDIAALAAALERLIGDSDFRRTLGQAAQRRHAERYDSTPYVRRLAEIWRQSASSATEGPR